MGRALVPTRARSLPPPPNLVLPPYSLSSMPAAACLTLLLPNDQPDQELPLDRINEALFERHQKPPNIATLPVRTLRPQRLLPDHYLFCRVFLTMRPFLYCATIASDLRHQLRVRVGQDHPGDHRRHPAGPNARSARGLRPRTQGRAKDILNATSIPFLQFFSFYLFLCASVRSVPCYLCSFFVGGLLDLAAHVRLVKKFNLAELRRMQRQFLKISQMHPPRVEHIGDTFVEYLNTSLA